MSASGEVEVVEDGGIRIGTKSRSAPKTKDMSADRFWNFLKKRELRVA